MSVSARTFQLLYIIRQRALEDLPTTVADFSAFIAKRRAEAPLAYSTAYISPSAIQDMLVRMKFEGLVSWDGKEYQLEHMGSQMADLLEGIDACTTSFIDQYKECVVKAVLEQRHRLGQPPANQRDIAACANISLDSARRGLQTLIAQGAVTEHTQGRVQTYTLTSPPAVLSLPKDPGIREVLETIDDSQPAPKIREGMEFLATLDDDILPVSAPVDPVDPEDEVPVPLGEVLQDGGPDTEPAQVPSSPTVEEANAHFDEAAQEQAEQDPSRAEVAENPPRDACAWARRPPGRFMDSDPWATVPEHILNALYVQASAADMCLDEFLDRVVKTNERRIRKALFSFDS